MKNKELKECLLPLNQNMKQKYLWTKCLFVNILSRFSGFSFVRSKFSYWKKGIRNEFAQHKFIEYRDVNIGSQKSLFTTPTSA